MSKKPDYSLVEQMLFKGFITTKMEFNGVPIVLKSLNHHESELIEMSRPLSGLERHKYEMAYIISYSTFMFNGVNVLTDRDTYILMLTEMYMEYPQRVLERIIARLHGLTNKSTEALLKVQAYSYGTDSFQNWAAYQNIPLNSVNCTGIQGTENLGYSAHQKLWIHFNRNEDWSSQIEVDWDLAKFLASDHNSKGIQSLDAKDQARRSEERKRRTDLYFGRESVIETAKGYTEIKISNETTEELKRQMMNELAGHKDFHDMVVAEHERKIKEKYELAMAERREKARQVREYQRAQMGDVSNKPLVIYDEHQVRQKVLEQQSLRRGYLEEGLYQSEKMLDQQRKHLARWGYIEEPSHFQKPEPLTGGSVLEDHYQEMPEDLLDPLGKKHGR